MRRRLALLTVLGIVVVVGVIGALLANGDRPVTPDSPGDVGLRTVGSATELTSGPENGLAGLSATRKWTADGTAFSSSIEVTNPSGQAVTSHHAEVIPKGVAVSTASVVFEPASPRVLKEDPIVAWDVTMAPGEKRTMSYRTTLARPATAEDLKAFEAERATTYKALLDFITSQAGAAPTAVPDLAAFEPPAPPAAPAATPAAGAPAEAAAPPAPPANQAPGAAPGITSTSMATTTKPQAQPPAPPPPQPLTVPGAVGNVIVSGPAGDAGSVTVSLTWSPPAGSQVQGYRVRRTTLGSSASTCDNAGVVRAGPVDQDTGATSMRATAAGATEPCLSWIRWEVAAFNTAGVGPFVAATGVLPDVRGLQHPYHLVRAVGGRAAGAPDRNCGVPQYAGCETSPVAGTRIPNGTTVTMYLQQ